MEGVVRNCWRDGYVFTALLNLLPGVMPPEVVLTLDSHRPWRRLGLEILSRRIPSDQLRHEGRQSFAVKGC